MHRITRARVQRYFPLSFCVVNIEGRKKRERERERERGKKQEKKEERGKKGGTFFRESRRLDRITSIMSNWADIPKNDMWT